MKLNYTLDSQQMDALALTDGESICYCVPVDLSFDSQSRLAREAYVKNECLVVTQRRFLEL